MRQGPPGAGAAQGGGIGRPGAMIPARAAWSVLLFAVAYSAAYLYGIALPVPAPLWPPDAVLLATLLLTPPRRWWVFLLLAAIIWAGPAFSPVVPLWLLIVNYLNDALTALLAAVLLRRVVGRRVDLTDLRTLGAYVACAVLAAPLLSACVGAAGLAALGAPYWPEWWMWFLGNALTNLVLTPALLLWAGSGRPVVRVTSWRRAGEAVLLVVALLYCCGRRCASARAASPAPSRSSR
jgi:integral membrane sensor domain MASE1